MATTDYVHALTIQIQFRYLKAQFHFTQVYQVIKNPQRRIIHNFIIEPILQIKRVAVWITQIRQIFICTTLFKFGHRY